MVISCKLFRGKDFVFLKRYDYQDWEKMPSLLSIPSQIKKLAPMYCMVINLICLAYFHPKAYQLLGKRWLSMLYVT